MPFEKSAGAIIFRKANNEIYYLLLHYPSTKRGAESDYWDFPKGHIEKGEKEIETVKREVEEETGLQDLRFIKDFKEWIKYFFRFKGKTIFKIVTFYLVKTNTEKIRTSFEHIGYQWLPYKKALKTLNFKNAKNILEKANKFLENT